MKIVVIGGSGLIGSKLVTKLREHGHEAVAASPNSGGVNTLTGQGLAEVHARLGETRFEDWLNRSTLQIPAANPQPPAVAAAPRG